MENLELKETTDNLLKVIKKLSEFDRLIISLYYYEEASYEEISKILDIPIEKVADVHRKIIKSLSEALNEEDYL